MIRARFRTNALDYRPVVWPVKHPYWCSGYGASYAIVVAYADDESEIKRNWPDATNIDAEEAVDYMFTDRFPKPSWFGASGHPRTMIDVGSYADDDALMAAVFSAIDGFGGCEEAVIDAKEDLRPEHIRAAARAHCFHEFRDALPTSLRRYAGWCVGRLVSPADLGIRPGANLQGEVLYQANLAGIHLSNANCAGADFRWANCEGVDFSGACVKGATFAGARLSRPARDLLAVAGAYCAGAVVVDRAWRKKELSHV